MTGYSVRTRDTAQGSLTLELKGVNSRFLDFHFRMAEEWRSLEIPLRELISSRVNRGKLECRLGFTPANSRSQELAINGDLLQALSRLEAEVRGRLPAAAPLSVAEVLRWPGILGEETVDATALQKIFLELAREALDEFGATRLREGEKLAAMIRERTVRMREIVADVGPRIPALQEIFAERLRTRLQEAMSSVDDDRIRQEVVLFAARIDVAEELSRLLTHLDEVDRILASKGPAGKRLDFLMQELNREANTLGSKSAVAEVSAASLELKLLIEQMREQIQNIE